MAYRTSCIKPIANTFPLFLLSAILHKISYAQKALSLCMLNPDTFYCTVKCIEPFFPQFAVNGQPEKNQKLIYVFNTASNYKELVVFAGKSHVTSAFL